MLDRLATLQYHDLAIPAILDFAAGNPSERSLLDPFDFDYLKLENIGRGNMGSYPDTAQ